MLILLKKMFLKAKKNIQNKNTSVDRISWDLHKIFRFFTNFFKKLKYPDKYLTS